jgi:microcystin-dependent protein
MAEPFLGQVEVFSFNFPPKGWAVCAAQLLPINQNQALFSLLGTTYGGDGIRTFGLPDLRGRIAVGWGQGPGLSNYNLGQLGGQETHTINNQEMGSHTHNWMVNSTTPATANTAVPSTSVVLGQTTGVPAQGALFPLLLYTSGSPGGALNSNSINTSGNNQPHPNIMPYLTLNICIALQGIFPSRN